MMPGKRASLRRTLLTRLLVPMVPLLLAGVAVAFYMSYQLVNEAYDRSLIRAARALADQIMVVKGRVSVDLPDVAFQMLEYDKHDWIYYKVTGPDGEVVTGYEDLPAPPITRPVPGRHYYYQDRYGDKKISAVAFYLSLKGTQARGMTLIQVAETTAKRQQVAGEIVFGMVLPQLLMVMLAAWVVWRGVSQGLAPLEQMRLQIVKRSQHDMSPLDVTRAPEEIRPILDAMNDLIQRLQQVMAQQQRFVADASHQLRTPLAGLKTQAAIAAQESNPELLRHALQQIQTSSSHLGHMVSQLLSLARLEPDIEGPPMEKTDLTALAQEITSGWVPAALAKDIDLGFEATSRSLTVYGNTALLREMLANLIDNALRYTQRGGQVTVKAETAADGGVVLYVEDNGPGIPEEERERVFERFYRILGTEAEGCGLGLAIVREIAQRHGAKVSIATAPGGDGTCVRVEFPPVIAASCGY